MMHPISETVDSGTTEGLIRAKGALQLADDVMDELVQTIYRNRESTVDREVDL